MDTVITTIRQAKENKKTVISLFEKKTGVKVKTGRFAKGSMKQYIALTLSDTKELQERIDNAKGESELSLYKFNEEIGGTYIQDHREAGYGVVVHYRLYDIFN